MKKFIHIIIALCCAVSAFGQIPQAFTYQGQATLLSGQPVASATIGLEFSIQNNANGTTVYYTERITADTDPNGVFTVAVGTGTVQVGSFVNIDWSTAKYLRTKIDVNNSGNFVNIGASQILSIPYALYAEKAGKTNLNTAGAGLSFDANTNTLTAAAPQLAVNGNRLEILGGNTVTLPSANFMAGVGIAINSGTITNAAPDQLVTITGTGGVTVSGTYPTFTITSTAQATPTFTGDISNVGTALTVIALQGKGVSATPPINEQILQYNSAQGKWIPVTLNLTPTMTGDVAGTTGSNVVTKIQGKAVSATAPTAGQPLVWNSTTSQWEPTTLSLTPTMTGDVTGTTAANTVTKIQGKAVSATAPTAGQPLVWNSTTSQWQPTTLNIPAQVNIAAGNGISVTGAYPNVTIANTSVSPVIVLNSTNYATITAPATGSVVNVQNAITISTDYTKLQSSHRSTIIGGSFTGTAGTETVYFGTNSTIQGVSFTNVKIYGARLTFVNCIFSSGSDAAFTASFYNCTFSNVTTSLGYVMNCDISNCTIQSVKHISNSYITNCTISGNLEDVLNCRIYSSTINCSTGDVKIQNNYLNLCKLNVGVSGSSPSRLMIQGNVFNNLLSGQSEIIYVDASSANYKFWQIQNNNFSLQTNDPQAISIQNNGHTYGLAGITIQGNFFAKGQNAISSSSNIPLIVTNNVTNQTSLGIANGGNNQVSNNYAY
jgi:hypothetical protein